MVPRTLLANITFQNNITHAGKLGSIYLSGPMAELDNCANYRATADGAHNSYKL